MFVYTRTHQVASIMNLGSRPCLVMLSAWGRPLQLEREMGTLRAVPILAERCSLDNRYVK